MKRKAKRNVICNGMQKSNGVLWESKKGTLHRKISSILNRRVKMRCACAWVRKCNSLCTQASNITT